VSAIAGMASASVARDLSKEVDRLTRDLAHVRAERDQVKDSAEAVVNRWACGEPLDKEMRELRDAIGWEAAP